MNISDVIFPLDNLNIKSESPRMQVIYEMGQAWVAGHMPPFGHHVAPTVNTRKGRRRFKVRRYGTVIA